MVDWIASDENLFPLENLERPREVASEIYAQNAWKKLQFLPRWGVGDSWQRLLVNDYFQLRFNQLGNVSPRPLQTEAVGIANELSEPGIMVIEAPMGEGKTEAALLAAEIMASKTGRKGLFFALPTQATADGLFPRILEWIKTLDQKKHPITLAHGKAKFNEEYKGLTKLSSKLNIMDDLGDLKYSEYNAVVHEWFLGRKRGILADFAVGTVDQVLMVALRQRHLALRHLGFIDKVVVIDECHAYGAYMSHYLEMALQWLGAYGVPVIVLSATLPAEKRKTVVEAYLNKKLDESEKFGIRSYPLITYSDGDKVFFKEIETSGRNTEIQLQFLSREEEKDLPRLLKECLSDGGYVGIIQNTIKRARETVNNILKEFDEENVELFHAQFFIRERIRKEKKIRDKLGPTKNRPPGVFIVIGTQVLEQSLDIDFDLLITDIAPIDLIIQRIGRLHRHERKNRPPKLRTAKCFVLGVYEENGRPIFDSDSEIIYKKYLLMSTFARLKEVKTISIPEDIPDLVQDVYGQDGVAIPIEWIEDYNIAKAYYEKEKQKKIEKQASIP